MTSPFPPPSPTLDDRTYLLVGTVTRDRHGEDRFTPGGTVTYAGVLALRLGWRPVILTAAAADFASPACLKDADWRVLPSAETTSFLNQEIPFHGRRQIIGPVARAIRAEDVPRDCLGASIVHICPLAQDVAPEIVDLFGHSLRVTTLQGWLRRWNARGVVSLGDWRRLRGIVRKFDLAVLSDEDLGHRARIAVALAAHAPVLAVTRGPSGCAVFARRQVFSSPPRPCRCVDPTGAGDVFAAAFFIRYHETGDLERAAYFANVAASLSIERPGPCGAPYREQIEDYIATHPRPLLYY